jgi:hypothetical protein
MQDLFEGELTGALKVRALFARLGQDVRIGVSRRQTVFEPPTSMPSRSRCITCMVVLSAPTWCFRRYQDVRDPGDRGRIGVDIQDGALGPSSGATH